MNCKGNTRPSSPVAPERADFSCLSRDGVEDDSLLNPRTPNGGSQSAVSRQAPCSFRWGSRPSSGFAAAGVTHWDSCAFRPPASPEMTDVAAPMFERGPLSESARSSGPFTLNVKLAGRADPERAHLTRFQSRAPPQLTGVMVTVSVMGDDTVAKLKEAVAGEEHLSS